jgi:hypothetical protein
VRHVVFVGKQLEGTADVLRFVRQHKGKGRESSASSA